MKMLGRVLQKYLWNKQYTKVADGVGTDEINTRERKDVGGVRHGSVWLCCAVNDFAVIYNYLTITMLIAFNNDNQLPLCLDIKKPTVDSRLFYVPNIISHQLSLLNTMLYYCYERDSYK